MTYLLVGLQGVDPRRVATLLGALSGSGVRVIYDGYAPIAWIVSYNGTPRQLTDLIWPDDVDEEDYAIEYGVVVRINHKTINGFTATEFWEFFSKYAD